MVHNINAENPQIREMHSENIRLRASLEDYQRALEHIMTKYREHSQSALAKTKINFEEMFRAETEKNVVCNMHCVVWCGPWACEQNLICCFLLPADSTTGRKNSRNDCRHAKGRPAR